MSNTYRFDTYIRRGLYGTTVALHPVGAQFARLDGAQLVIPYTTGMVGKTILVKLLSLNPTLTAEQALSSVQPYAYVVQGST
jgi:hypothetical protein